MLPLDYDVTEQMLINLLKAAAPERSADLDSILSKNNISFSKVDDRSGFVLDAASFGVIRYTNRTLLTIWAMGWILWNEMYCWSTFIWLLSKLKQPFIFEEFQKLPGQEELYAQVDSLFTQVNEFARCESFDSELWPRTIPLPDMTILKSPEDRLISDICQLSVAFVLLHEIKHVIFSVDGNSPRDFPIEELACDEWAAEFLLRDSKKYGEDEGYDPLLVTSKRAMGVDFAASVIAHLRDGGFWEASTTHPAAAVRMDSLAKLVQANKNDYFWNVGCSYLLAKLRRENAIPSRIDFLGQKDLFVKLLQSKRVPAH